MWWVEGKAYMYLYIYRRFSITFLYARHACFPVISEPISIAQHHQQANDPKNSCLIAKREVATAFSKNN